MLIMSFLAECAILLAYVMNGVSPGTLPISLLRDSRSYHAVLAVLTVTWMVYVWHGIRARHVAEVVCAGGIGIALMVLQALTNDDAGHDTLATILMVMTCLLTVKVALRLEHIPLVFLAMVSLTSTSLLVTQNPLLLGVTENTVVLVTLIILTVDQRRHDSTTATHIDRGGHVTPFSLLSRKNPARWRYMVGRRTLLRVPPGRHRTRQSRHSNLWTVNTRGKVRSEVWSMA